MLVAGQKKIFPILVCGHLLIGRNGMQTVLLLEFLCQKNRLELRLESYIEH